MCSSAAPLRQAWMIIAMLPNAPAALRCAVFRLFADALDRDDALALGGVEHDHPLRRAAGDADAVDRAADELALVGDEHDLVGVLDREGADDLAVLLADRHRDDAFAAAAGDAVLVGRGALAVAVFGQREDELLGRAHGGVALLRKLDRLHLFFLFVLAFLAAAHGVGHLQIGHAL